MQYYTADEWAAIQKMYAEQERNRERPTTSPDTFVYQPPDITPMDAEALNLYAGKEDGRRKLSRLLPDAEYACQFEDVDAYNESAANAYATGPWMGSAPVTKAEYEAQVRSRMKDWYDDGNALSAEEFAQLCREASDTSSPAGMFYRERKEPDSSPDEDVLTSIHKAAVQEARPNYIGLGITAAVGIAVLYIGYRLLQPTKKKALKGRSRRRIR